MKNLTLEMREPLENICSIPVMVQKGVGSAWLCEDGGHRENLKGILKQVTMSNTNVK